MKKPFLFGLGVGLLLASASAGFATSTESRFGHPSRQLANERSEERKANPQPYALTGSENELSWKMQVDRNPSGRVRMPAFKRTPADS